MLFLTPVEPPQLVDAAPVGNVLELLAPHLHVLPLQPLQRPDVRIASLLLTCRYFEQSFRALTPSSAQVMHKGATSGHRTEYRGIRSAKNLLQTHHCGHACGLHPTHPTLPALNSRRGRL